MGVRNLTIRLGGGEDRFTSATILRLVAVTVLTGVGAGLGGMSLAMLLRVMQHIAYGYGLDAVFSGDSFLDGVSAAEPARRVFVMVICGFVAGGGWWALHRFGSALVSIDQAIRRDDPRMPLMATATHAVLQIATVALGSPLGREVAPREIGAMLGGWLSHRAGLSAETSRIMVACGAGAGLAAVYNVPLAGALFALEVLLGTFRSSAAIPAIATSVIATAVAWIGLGDEPQYAVPSFPISASLVTWSIVMGPLFGFAAYGYARLAAAARARAPRDWRLVIWCVGTFLVIGMLSIPFPQLLGNGKDPTQLDFSDELGIGIAVTLVVLKVAATATTLRAGAHGGLLTPSLTIGALLASVAGGLWNLVWPGVPLGAFAIVGAAAFLAASMEMPLTAIVLIVELTRVGHNFLIPIIVAVAGAMSIYRLCALRLERGITNGAVTAETRIPHHAMNAQLRSGTLSPQPTRDRFAG